MPPACRYTLLQQEFLQARGALLDLEVAAGSAQAGWKAADRRAADAEAQQAAMSVELAEARAAKVKLEMDLVGAWLGAPACLLRPTSWGA